ncbi:hypothetical protein MESS2_640014 [Mesorhizobium metallidurans STM 2683]|uniref:Uncharacterized protein n=1 Tax=Mesorhizobium metallidurans STM 2683 TaxID=1297569 RepID=M5EV04_9HYPH|nr:hypothetical protein MESS2_640014 [Mesorhizobium metallidurans STM 2683]
MKRKEQALCLRNDYRAKPIRSVFRGMRFSRAFNCADVFAPGGNLKRAPVVSHRAVLEGFH